jgi:hypothetical protein
MVPANASVGAVNRGENAEPKVRAEPDQNWASLRLCEDDAGAERMVWSSTTAATATITSKLVPRRL